MSESTNFAEPRAVAALLAEVVDAVVFDMDGVVTRTAEVHAQAWRRMFDGFLARRAVATGEALAPFEFPADYLARIDGRPRYEGVATFLASRGIELPMGSPEDAPGDTTVGGLGNAKNVEFNRILERDGVAVFASTVALIEALQEAGVRVGLATSSRNSALVLERSGTARLFATVVDGLVSAALGLRGKPAPDIFTTACARLDASPDRCVVIEDAVTGVEAGRRGGFALTIGLAREDNASALRDHGADLVVADLAEIRLPDLRRLVLARRALQP
ncbi:HAD family hydrolase [Actomonas aquatica]|uniref:HAD-IA family hydrolase n=1 Tax=Actomonas aquatica TaxID=2866162 RepID=A0ABZ1CE85_9BACT|nr:HAD-IA family hydrolase [Opitutus sp. WL0086]WRQ89997.1 HAD-IA family hydrolase [Opitutus sp. WL0086]